MASSPGLAATAPNVLGARGVQCLEDAPAPTKGLEAAGIEVPQLGCSDKELILCNYPPPKKATKGMEILMCRGAG